MSWWVETMSITADACQQLTVRSHSSLAANMVTALLANSLDAPQREVRVEVENELSPPGVRIELSGVDGWLFLSLDSDLPAVVTALSEGASGILTMASAPEDVERALQVLVDGGTGYLPVEILRRLAASNDALELPPVSDEAKSPTALTDREIEVLERIARGDTNSHIAADLGISYHTVRSHMRALAMKLGTQSRSAMEAKARAMVADTRRPSRL